MSESNQSIDQTVPQSPLHFRNFHQCYITRFGWSILEWCQLLLTFRSLFTTAVQTRENKSRQTTNWSIGEEMKCEQCWRLQKVKESKRNLCSSFMFWSLLICPLSRCTGSTHWRLIRSIASIVQCASVTHHFCPACITSVTRLSPHNLSSQSHIRVLWKRCFHFNFNNIPTIPRLDSWNTQHNNEAMQALWIHSHHAPCLVTHRSIYPRPTSQPA
jgi:hypothetical protein